MRPVDWSKPFIVRQYLGQSQPARNWRAQRLVDLVLDDLPLRSLHRLIYKCDDAFFDRFLLFANEPTLAARRER